MKLVRLLYCSRKNTETSQLLKIREESKDYNKKNEISGVLCYSYHSFLQYIEGPEEKVNELFKHIIADERHTDVTLIDYEIIDVRLFGKWEMLYIDYDQIEKGLNFKYGSANVFDPYSMTKNQAIGFLKDASER